MSPAPFRVALVASLTLIAGLAVAQPTSPPFTAFEGHWVGLGVEPGIGNSRFPNAADRKRTAGSSLAFSARAFIGPWGMSCANPRYTVLLVPPEGLFQGMLAGRDAADDADRIGFDEGDVPTLRVDCANATFDFHLESPTSLRFAFNGLIYLFKKPKVAPPSRG